MITQDFIRELEIALLKSYNRAARTGPSRMGATIVEAARTQEQFMSAFLTAFREQFPQLEREIARGGHRDPSRLMTTVERQIDAKIRTLLLRGGSPDQSAFQRAVRDLKSEVRSVFYEPSR